MGATPQTWEFGTPDGGSGRGQLFEANDGWGVAVLAPAMGVSPRFYGAFAADAAQRGLSTLVVEYRGLLEGVARGAASPALHDWGEQDLAGAVRALGDRFAGVPLLWIGHSIGGQLLGLLEQAPVRGALLVAAQSGYWRHWPTWRRWLMAGLWHVAIPALVAGTGRLPMKALGQGEDVPAGVAREWAQWGRHPDYIWSYAKAQGGRAFATYRGPLLSYAIEGDGYAPVPAVEALARCYASAESEVRVLGAGELGAARLGHFGFFKPSARQVAWQPALAWLQAVARG